MLNALLLWLYLAGLIPAFIDTFRAAEPIAKRRGVAFGRTVGASAAVAAFWPLVFTAVSAFAVFELARRQVRT